MIEQNLQQAAEQLPEHRSDYLAVEERLKKKQFRSRPVRRKRIAVAMVLAVLLVGCVAVMEPDYHLYNGNWWQFIPGLHFDPADTFELHWDQTQKAAEGLGITLPETLGDNPVIDYDRFNLTNQETLIQFAWLKPRYVYQSAYYGVEKEEPYLTEDGREGTRHWREGAEITFGSTEDEIWRRQFGFDENDVYVAGNYILANYPVVEITALEYEGITLYVGQIHISSYEQPLWDVTWVDHGKGVVFSIDGEFETPDTLIEYAKLIVDLNR